MTTEVLTQSILGPLADAVSDVVERLRASVVAVRSPRGGGSGTIWREDGLIVTNHHVVPGDRAEVVTWDDRAYAAEVIARDAEHDLAALKVQAGGLPAAPVADSDELKVGQLVLAVGNPWGQRGAVTAGIILSTTGVTVENQTPLPDSVRADVRLAPGNSGGPLANTSGAVIGINSMIAGGMAVAVPSNIVARFVEGEAAAQRGFIGISAVPAPLPPAIAASYQMEDGAALLLTEIADGSPAAGAGLLPGDVLLGLGGGHGMRAVARGLRRMRPGVPVRLFLLRGGVHREIELIPTTWT
jgi:serine protease Do